MGVAALIAVLAASFPAAAHAHKVNIFAYAEGGKVHTESYFADGARASGCRVTVEDLSGEVLLEGRTDKDGIFAFDIPAKEDLRIVLHASMGHKNDYVIKASELEAAVPQKKISSAGGRETIKKEPTAGKPGAVKKEQGQVKSTVKEPEKAENPPSLSAEEMRAIVDEAVEARLKPLYGMLSEMREASEKPRLSEVIGGIGYIMGIMGVIAYFKSRKV